MGKSYKIKFLVYSSLRFVLAGPVFLYSTGIIQQLYITDAEMVKEICLCTSLNLGKPSYLSKDRGPLLGRGIFSSNGPIWVHQRKTIAPEFYVEKVKVNLRQFTITNIYFSV